MTRDIVIDALCMAWFKRHLIRNSLDYASWKDRKALAAANKPIHTAASAEAELAKLEAFEAGPWGVKFPTMAATWRRA